MSINANGAALAGAAPFRTNQLDGLNGSHNTVNRTRRQAPASPPAPADEPVITVSITLPLGSFAAPTARQEAARAARLGAVLGRALRQAFAGAAVVQPIDAVAAFLAARCERVPGAAERASTMLSAYHQWAAGSGAPKLTAAALARGLRAAGLQRRKSSVMIWVGLRLSGGAHVGDGR
ncbi:hypothetical protein [Rhodoplanes sp. SY1]|uniref:hypothetical protein n=1 Tax=Rhodoplanes sp. SY1 TaxID=3166646 RepID=UPI0038B6316D